MQVVSVSLSLKKHTHEQWKNIPKQLMQYKGSSKDLTQFEQ